MNTKTRQTGKLNTCEQVEVMPISQQASVWKTVLMLIVSLLLGTVMAARLASAQETNQPKIAVQADSRLPSLIRVTQVILDNEGFVLHIQDQLAVEGTCLIPPSRRQRQSRT